MFKDFKLSRRAPAAAAVLALLASLAPSAAAQDGAPQTETPQTQTQPRQATRPAQTDASAEPSSQVASAPAAEAVAAQASPAPHYREYRGVTLGMSASDVRAKLGKPAEKSDGMDFFVFNDRERARVYYKEGKASAVIATYVGKNASAPAPAAVLGRGFRFARGTILHFGAQQLVTVRRRHPDGSSGRGLGRHATPAEP